MHPDYLRQRDILPQELMKEVVIHLIGCGAIGSMTGAILAKMGLPILNVYDPDKLEPHNLPNQFLPLPKEEGKEGFLKKIINNKPRKVECFKDLVAQIAESEVKISRRRIGSKLATSFEGIVITAVDSMKSRRKIFDGIKFRRVVPLFIDGRMGGETGRVYTIVPYDAKEVDFYEDSLYSDDEAGEGICTARGIIYNTAFIGSLIAAQLKKFLQGEEYPQAIIFDLRNYRIIQEVI